MSWSYRCSNEKCKKRLALPRNISWYRPPPRCKGCGGYKYRWDPWQQFRGIKQNCWCGGYHFPHRKGSKWCIHAIDTVTLQEAAKRWGGEPIDYVDIPDSRVGKGIKSDEPPF